MRRPGVAQRAVFVEDYDMALATELVHGIDLWINTPRRPWEACGTSGMKVLVNGGLNLSELDGWWAEAFSPEIGWALGDGRDHGDDPGWDGAEAEALYALLEREVLPEFYARDASGIPGRWVARMRESMALLTPRFSANRMVRQYVRQYYLPAAQQVRRRSASGGALGGQIEGWAALIDRQWHHLRFGALRTSEEGDERIFEVELYLGSLAPAAVRVEVYADATAAAPSERVPMAAVRRLVNGGGGWLFRAPVAKTRPASDYTPRAIPAHADALDLEISHVLWHH